jgi:hypothetical protein
MPRIFGVHAKAPLTNLAAYTAVVGGGGTLSYNNVLFERDGGDLVITGSFTTGTPTATLATMSLPPGLAIDPSRAPIVQATGSPGPNIGSWYQIGPSGQGAMTTALTTSASVVYFCNQPQNGNLVPINATSIWNAGQLVSVAVRVPIVGWSADDVLRPDGTKI